MNKILLGVIGNGRRELLEQTVASAESHLQGEFSHKIMINDAPSEEYNHYLIKTYGDRFTIVNHGKNRGLSGSIRSLWYHAQRLDVDYVFHLEEDFTFNQNIYISDLINVLECDYHIAQIALKRQPCNPAEAEVGGFMEQNPTSYVEHTIGRSLVYRLGFSTPRQTGKKIEEVNYLNHRNFFTLNPCLYPISTTQIGWERGWGEKEFGERLFANELTQCAYLGRIEDAPLVEHIGGYRGENWYV